MRCPSCNHVIDGSLSSRGYIWCKNCSKRICTELEFVEALNTMFGVPKKIHTEAEGFTLVWINDPRGGGRHTVAVPPHFAETWKLERVKF